MIGDEVVLLSVVGIAMLGDDSPNPLLSETVRPASTRAGYAITIKKFLISLIFALI